MSTEKAAGGLRGVSAGQTAIATVGDGHGLRYRGYDVVELAANATFEEVAYLLLRGELPNARELERLRAALRSRRELPRALCEVLERIPASAHPMDVMRTG
jgi:2-methylcitrate synthase